MSLKRFGILAIALFVMSAFAPAALADGPLPGPPLADGYDGTYYEGIWQINITTYCNRHTDGAPVTLGTERLYLRVEFDCTCDTYYIGCLFPTLEDARNCTNQVGLFDFYFDFPEYAEETYVFEGFSGRGVDDPKFVGECAFGFVGWLKTVVKTSPQNKLYNKLIGSGGGFCYPDDPDEPLLACNIKAFNAGWLEELPSCVP